jgi:hypothetical protein
LYAIARPLTLPVESRAAHRDAAAAYLDFHFTQIGLLADGGILRSELARYG